MMPKYTVRLTMHVFGTDWDCGNYGGLRFVLVNLEWARQSYNRYSDIPVTLEKVLILIFFLNEKKLLEFDYVRSSELESKTKKEWRLVVIYLNMSNNCHTNISNHKFWHFQWTKPNVTRTDIQLCPFKSVK